MSTAEFLIIILICYLLELVLPSSHRSSVHSSHTVGLQDPVLVTLAVNTGQIQSSSVLTTPEIMSDLVLLLALLSVLLRTHQHIISSHLS